MLALGRRPYTGAAELSPKERKEKEKKSDSLGDSRLNQSVPSDRRELLSASKLNMVEHNLSIFSQGRERFKNGLSHFLKMLSSFKSNKTKLDRGDGCTSYEFTITHIK